MQGFALLIFCAASLVMTVLLHVHSWRKFAAHKERQAIERSFYNYCLLTLACGYIYLSSLVEIDDRDFTTNFCGVMFILISMTVNVLLTKIPADNDQQLFY